MTETVVIVVVLLGVGGYFVRQVVLPIIPRVKRVTVEFGDDQSPSLYNQDKTASRAVKGSVKRQLRS